MAGPVWEAILKPPASRTASWFMMRSGLPSRKLSIEVFEVGPICEHAAETTKGRLKTCLYTLLGQPENDFELNVACVRMIFAIIAKNAWAPVDITGLVLPSRDRQT
jgi:hypothetical protein